MKLLANYKPWGGLNSEIASRSKKENDLSPLLQPEAGNRADRPRTDLFQLAKDLRRLEKRAATAHRKSKTSSSKLVEIMSGVIKSAQGKSLSSRQALVHLGSKVSLPYCRPHWSRHKDDLNTLLYAIDGFLQWSRSREPVRGFLNISNRTRFKCFRYSRANLPVPSILPKPTSWKETEIDEQPSEEWHLLPDSGVEQPVSSLQQITFNVDILQSEFYAIIGRLSGFSHVVMCDPSIVLPPPPVVDDDEDDNDDDEKDDHSDRKSGKESIKGDNDNATTLLEDTNQNQITFDKFKPTVISLRRSSKASRISIESDYSCKLTIFAAYIALKWVRHMLAVGKKQGVSVTSEVFLGRISVTSRSASLFAVLDLSPDTIITCPKLKDSLIEASVNEQKYALRASFLKGGIFSRRSVRNLQRLPMLLLSRNRARFRRSPNASWGIVPSSPARPRRNLMKSATGGERSTLFSPYKSFRRRNSSTSIHLAARRSSITSISTLQVDLAGRESEARRATLFRLIVSSPLTALRADFGVLNRSNTTEVSIISSVLKSRTKQRITRVRGTDAVPSSKEIEAMFKRLQMKNAPGYLALRPLQRIAESIKSTLAGLTISMMRGCKYHQVKVTRLGPTLAFVLRNQIRDLLNEHHECEETKCRDRPSTEEEKSADNSDTAAFRVVTHVTVVEALEQGVMTASQALKEDNMDTYYSFVYKDQDAITVSAVYLMRQFVRFPNVVITANPVIREAYERWLN
ncbi:unnamed protein product [Mesocestoides corti]|uniref:Uncharacterized protein n=1 Tax=Mesocestoides corti TaxID=53468 RepID=A0A0R3U4S5_MESCO|nr:unnamed protein product [Mesocestoides corti]